MATEGGERVLTGSFQRCENSAGFCFIGDGSISCCMERHCLTHPHIPPLSDNNMEVTEEQPMEGE